MANQEHLDILKQGADTWNQWRKEHPNIRPDLSLADLKGADLSGAFLNGADLREADLSETRFYDDTTPMGLLTGASFIKANLRGANLTEADLSHVNLIGADLSEANLNKARLPKSIISEATLTGAFLKEVDLSGVDLSKKDLSRVNFSGANLMQVNLTDAILRGADLSNANLSGALLLQTNLEDATLNRCSIYGISAWSLRLEGVKQNSLVITPDNEPTITVDNLEVAQFVHLLLSHKKLRDVFNAVTQRGVLILGRFGGGGLEILQAIAVKLRKENYLPIIFDFEQPQDRDYTETVMTLVGLSRFVIVDLSGPSVPAELSHTVPFFDIPFVPIIEKGQRGYSMFVDLFKYPWMLRPMIEFATVDELLARIPSEVIAPAEEKHQARQKLLDELFNKT